MNKIKAFLTKRVQSDRPEGFTLIELIVVIIIIGILAALAVVSYAAVIGRSSDSRELALQQSLAREVQALLAFQDGTSPQDALEEALADMPQTLSAATVAAPRPVAGNPDWMIAGPEDGAEPAYQMVVWDVTATDLEWQTLTASDKLITATVALDATSSQVVLGDTVPAGDPGDPGGPGDPEEPEGPPKPPAPLFEAYDAETVWNDSIFFWGEGWPVPSTEEYTINPNTGYEFVLEHPGFSQTLRKYDPGLYFGVGPSDFWFEVDLDEVFDGDPVNMYVEWCVTVYVVTDDNVRSDGSEPVCYLPDWGPELDFMVELEPGQSNLVFMENMFNSPNRVELMAGWMDPASPPAPITGYLAHLEFNGAPLAPIHINKVSPNWAVTGEFWTSQGGGGWSGLTLRGHEFADPVNGDEWCISVTAITDDGVSKPFPAECVTVTGMTPVAEVPVAPSGLSLDFVETGANVRADVSWLPVADTAHYNVDTFRVVGRMTNPPYVTTPTMQFVYSADHNVFNGTHQTFTTPLGTMAGYAGRTVCFDISTVSTAGAVSTSAAEVCGMVPPPPVNAPSGFQFQEGGHYVWFQWARVENHGVHTIEDYRFEGEHTETGQKVTWHTGNLMGVGQNAPYIGWDYGYAWTSSFAPGEWCFTVQAVSQLGTVSDATGPVCRIQT